VIYLRLIVSVVDPDFHTASLLIYWRESSTAGWCPMEWEA